MINLGSIAGLHQHDQLAAYCQRCDAWRVLPFADWVAQGKGSLCIPRFAAAGVHDRTSTLTALTVVAPAGL